MEHIETPQANQLAAGVPGVITLGGETYSIPQATPQDMAAFGEEAVKISARLRSQRLLALFKELGSYDVAKQFLVDEEAAERQQLDTLMGAGLPTPNGQPVPRLDDRSYLFHRVALSADGAAYFFWSLARRNKPDLQLATIRAHVTDDTASALGMQLLMECGLGKVNPNSVGASGTPSS